MATGFMQRYKGKVVAQQLWLGSGATNGIYDSASGIRGSANLAKAVALTVTATANTDITASLPTGALLYNATVYTTTAFTAVTDATIQIGSASGGSQYVSAVSIKAAGIVRLTLLGSAVVSLASLPAGTPNVFIRIVQSGGSTAVGAATLILEYILP